MNQADIFATLCADFKRDFKFKITAEPGSREGVEKILPQFGFAKLRSMWNFYISDEKSVGYGISFKKFLEPAFQMKWAAVAHLKPKRGNVSSVKGSPYYRCGCGRETVILLATDDDLDEFPPIWEDPCPGRSLNSQFWTRTQWDAFYESGCGGDLVQVNMRPVTEKRADPREVREVVSAIQSGLEFNPDEPIRFETEVE